MFLWVLAVNDPKILIGIDMIPVCSRKATQDGLGGLFVGRMQYFPICFTSLEYSKEGGMTDGSKDH